VQTTDTLTKHHDKHAAASIPEAKAAAHAAAKQKGLAALGVVKKIARINQKMADLALVKWLVSNYHPLLTTEEADFRAFCRELNPEYTPPSVETLKDRIGRLNAAANQKVRKFSPFFCLTLTQIKEFLAERCETASFSSDGWTSKAGVSFTAVLLHCITTDFEVVTFCLAVKELEGALLCIAHFHVCHRLTHGRRIA